MNHFSVFQQGWLTIFTVSATEKSDANGPKPAFDSTEGAFPLLSRAHPSKRANPSTERGVTMVFEKQITQILTEQCIRHTYRPTDFTSRWFVDIRSYGTIEITLAETGESLLFRTSSLADLRCASVAFSSQVLRNAMNANANLQLGRFVGTETIHFEVPLSFPGDTPICAAQFLHGLNTTIANLIHGRIALGLFQDPNEGHDNLPAPIRNRLFPPRD